MSRVGRGCGCGVVDERPVLFIRGASGAREARHGGTERGEKTEK